MAPGHFGVFYPIRIAPFGFMSTSCSNAALQALPHEFPLRKAQPPFIRPNAALVQSPMQPDGQLLPHLTEITPQSLRLRPVPRRLERLVEGKPRLAGNAELLEGAVDQGLFGGARVHRGLHLGQAVGHKEDAIYQHAVGGALDLKVPEESVGAEEREDLVQAVVRFRVRVDVEGVRAGGQLGQRVCWTSSLGAQWEEWEIAYDLNALVAQEY